MSYGRILSAMGVVGGLLFGAVASPRAEEIKGPACVSDAGHLSINGKRAYGTCQGGTPVILANIEAPSLAQTCSAPSGEEWPCGRWAAYFLLEMIKNKPVACRVKIEDSKGNKMALCLVERMEVNLTLVSLGWAVAQGTEARYYAAQDEARAKKVGMWQGTFLRPSEWEARHGAQ